MKKITFQRGLFIILLIVILLQVIDTYAGKNFFDVFFCLFLFIMGISIGSSFELE